MAGADSPLDQSARKASVPASSHFRYRNGVLCADERPLDAVAEQFGTPSYVYSAASIDAAYAGIDAALADSPHLVAYAVKANGNLAILSRLARAGAGADIVSGGELARARKAGFSPDRIVFSGVGKTEPEIRAALEAGVRSIHAESEGEIDVIERVAAALGKPAHIALRINPDVDPATHPYIATGLRNSKFGIELDVARRLLPRLLRSPHLRLEGVACHIGSMVLSPEPIGEAVAITASFAAECVRSGAPIRTLDAGGGWPIMYGDEDAEAAAHARFGRTIIDAVQRGNAAKLGLCLVVEPGRSIVGDSGVLLTRVLYVKEQGDKRFVIVDAAMTELIRPSLYGAYHAVMPVTEAAPDAAWSPSEVVGPVCESGDFLAKNRALPPLRPGDLLAVRGAGAYAASMASNYNARPFAPEVLIDAGQARLVRRRQTIEAMWAAESID
jgi:diaminopimelate decarboxylase